MKLFARLFMYVRNVFIFLMRALQVMAGHLSSHRAMKAGLVIQTAVALFLLLSPAQVGSEAARASCTERKKTQKTLLHVFICLNTRES